MIDDGVIKMCCARACDFVKEHGAEWTKGIARFAVGRGSREEAVRGVAKFQNPDGGWWGIGTLKAPISTISNTINGLFWLAMIDEHDSPLLDSTAEFLKSHQHSEGFWDEPEEILSHNPRPWMKPGNRANQVWYTALKKRSMLANWGKLLVRR